MKVIIFGTGKYYQRYKKCFNKKDIICFLDNDINKQGTFLDGIETFSPKVVSNKKFDYIYILSIYKKEMRNELLKLGVENDKIKDEFDINYNEINNELVIYGYSEQIKFLFTNKKKKILLISNNLDLYGAEIALLYLAKILKKIGYYVVVYSPSNGKLKKEYLSLEIPVIIDEDLYIAKLKDIEWTKSFSLILVNTIVFYRLLLSFNTNQPILWWLHDAEEIYQPVHNDLLNKINLGNISIYSVSSIAEHVLKNHISNINTELLPYGIPDFYKKKIHEKSSDKVIFAIIGVVSYRKGHDVLLSSIRQIINSDKENIEFWIIGNYDSDFGKKLYNEVLNISQIKMMGILERNEIESVYQQISALICPSREDPLPVVVTEAMMNCVPCIVSSGVGTAKFIKNGENGFIVPVEDSKKLADKMKWFIENKSLINKMGIKARKVYLDNFSMGEFEDKIKKIMKEKLPK